MTNIEIRVGSNDPFLGNPGLLNQKCGYITASNYPKDKGNSASNEKINSQEILNMNVTCSNGLLVGRFITIQKMEKNQLEIYDVLFYPKPGI